MTPSMHASAQASGLQQPDTRHVLAALGRVSTPAAAERLFALACEEAEVAWSGGSVDQQDLARVVDAISRQGGMAAVAAVAVKVRMSTYSARLRRDSR